MILDEFNIEAYVLDFTEGTLSQSEQKEVIQYLRNHRDIPLHPYEELPKLEILATPVFHNKVDLYSSTMEQIAEREENQIIGLLHGDLDVGDREELDRKLKNNAQLVSRLNEYKQTIISPDLTIVYPNLKDLKKRSLGKTIMPYLKWAGMAAAALVLLFFSPQIVGFFSSWGESFPTVYQNRNSSPIQFGNSDVEQVQETERRSAIFVYMMKPEYVAPKKPDNSSLLNSPNPTFKSESSLVELPKKYEVIEEEPKLIADTNVANSVAIIPKATEAPKKEPLKEIVKAEPVTKKSPVVAKSLPKTTPAKKKPSNKVTAKPSPKVYRAKKYKPLEPLNSLDANIAQEEETQYISLPSVEIRGIDNSNKAKDNKELPANRALRNTLFEAADDVGGKRIKYVKRKDGSYKLKIDLPFFSVERTIQD